MDPAILPGRKPPSRVLELGFHDPRPEDHDFGGILDLPEHLAKKRTKLLFPPLLEAVLDGGHGGSLLVGEPGVAPSGCTVPTLHAGAEADHLWLLPCPPPPELDDHRLPAAEPHPYFDGTFCFGNRHHRPFRSFKKQAPAPLTPTLTIRSPVLGPTTMSVYSSSSASGRPIPSRVTLRSLAQDRASGKRLAMLTAYDVVMAELLDQAGVDLILVGDSLGNVVLGYDTTIPVRLDDMIRHTAAVVRGTNRALVICDLPFGTYTDPETALRSAVRVFQETGCQAVKLEGGLALVPTVERLVSQGIPVMAHIGLTPQSVHQLGGYYRHGKTEDAAQRLREEALALEKAGAFALVLECVVPALASEITGMLQIPTIGIGSGPGCAGEVLVTHDLVGLNTRPAPSFAKPRAQVAALIRKAAESFVEDVKREGGEAPLSLSPAGLEPSP
jgi:3-methyl-2-oxobutanoate hydroxymethyltransferase